MVSIYISVTIAWRLWLSVIFFSLFTTGASVTSHTFLHKKQNGIDIFEYPPPYFISYNGQYWDTPKRLCIHTISNAIIQQNGLVFNKTYTASVNKWYWNSPPILGIKHVLSNREYVSFIQIWQENFQHIVFDTLPKASTICNLLINEWKYKYILIKSVLHGALIRYICPQLRKYVDRFHVLRQTLSAKSISVIYFDGNFQMGIVPPDSIPKIATGNNNKYVIYIPRKHGHSRSVTNEGAVLNVLREKFGPRLHIFQPTNHFKNDSVLFNNANIIIAPHGGALSNMIFAPNNTTIIEFLPLVKYKKKKLNERPCYFGLAKGLGFSYYSVEPDTFSFDTSIQISITMLHAVLNLI